MAWCGVEHQSDEVVPGCMREILLSARGQKFPETFVQISSSFRRRSLPLDLPYNGKRGLAHTQLPRLPPTQPSPPMNGKSILALHWWRDINCFEHDDMKRRSLQRYSKDYPRKLCIEYLHPGQCLRITARDKRMKPKKKRERENIKMRGLITQDRIQ